MQKKKIFLKIILVVLILSLGILNFKGVKGFTCVDCESAFSGLLLEQAPPILTRLADTITQDSAESIRTDINKIIKNINFYLNDKGCKNCGEDQIPSLLGLIGTLESISKKLGKPQELTILEEGAKNILSDTKNNIDNFLKNIQSVIDQLPDQPSHPPYQDLPETQPTQTKVEEEKASDICTQIASEDYEECSSSKNLKWYNVELWYCRIRAGLVTLYCRVMHSLITGLGAGISYVMNLEISMILWAINPQTYGGYSTNEGVRAVWGVVRDLVNLLLILGMIIIAIATMLKAEEWGWKNTLWKLVLVALLVNFSLVIPGTVIDLSNFLSFYFLNLARGNNQNLGQALLKGFGFGENGKAPLVLEKGPSELVPEAANSTKELIAPAAKEGFAGKFLFIFIGLLLIGVFAILVLFATFLVMIIRAVVLCILLVIAPLAFSAWIFPATSEYSRKWWRTLIKWCLMPVIFGFLLYLGIQFINVLAAKGGVSQEGIMASLIQFILFTMFLAVSLFVAVKQTDGLSEKIISATTSAISVALGGIAGYIGGAVTRRMAGGMGWSHKAYETVAKRLEESGFRPFHTIGFKMTQKTKEAREAQRKVIEDRFNKLSDDETDDEKKKYVLLPSTSQSEKAILLSQLFEKGKIGPEDYELIGMLREVGKHPFFNKKAVKDKRPDLFYQYLQEEDFKRDTEKIMREKKVSELTAQQMVIAQKIQESLVKASPEDLRQMEISKILTHLQNLGQLKPVLNELIYQKQIDAGNLAIIFEKMSAQERIKWADTFKKALMEIKNYQNETQLQKDLSDLGYLQNRLLLNLFRASRESQAQTQARSKIILPNDFEK